MPQKKPQKATKPATKTPQPQPQKPDPEKAAPAGPAADPQSSQSAKQPSSSKPGLADYIEKLKAEPAHSDQPDPAPGSAPKEPAINQEPDEFSKLLAEVMTEITIGGAEMVNTWRRKITLPATERQRDTIQRGWAVVMMKNMSGWMKDNPEWVMIGMGFGWVCVGNARDPKPAAVEAKQAKPETKLDGVHTVEVK